MMALYSQGNSRVKERKRRVSCLDKNEVLIWHLEQSQSTSMSTTSLSFQFDLEVSSICNREGNGTPLQYFAWKIPWMEEPGGLQSMGSLESDMTELLHFHFSLSYIGEGNDNPLQCSYLENPRDREPAGLPSMGTHRVGHDWSNLAAAAAAFAKNQISCGTFLSCGICIQGSIPSSFLTV